MDTFYSHNVCTVEHVFQLMLGFHNMVTVPLTAEQAIKTQTTVQKIEQMIESTGGELEWLGRHCIEQQRQLAQLQNKLRACI